MHFIRFFKINFLISSFLFASLGLLCQENSVFINPQEDSFNNKYKKNKSLKFLNKKINSLQNKGFITAFLDSVITSDAVYYKIEKGERYYCDFKTPEEISYIWKKQHIFKINDFKKSIEKSLQYYENNGYPYVTIEALLDSSSGSINDEKLDNSTVLNFNIDVAKGPYYVLDSISIKGNANIKRNVYQNMLDFKEYDFYEENKLNQITQTINNSLFLKSFKDSEIEFHDSTFTIYTYVNKANVSSFSGIIGFEQQDNGKLNLTGDLDLNLNNVFQHAESIKLNWKSYQNASQDLLLSASIPYVFNTSFGLNTSLKLNKQDSSFLNIDFKGGILFNIKPNTTLLINFNQVNSSLLGSQVSSEYLNSTMSLFGIGVKTVKLDYPFNPQKGYSFEFIGSFGQKDYPGQSALSDTSYSSVTSMLYETKFNWYIPIVPKLTFLIGANSKANFSDLIYKNELFRIGGAKILRGFDQESIFTSWYIVNTLEIRYIFEEYSNFYAFCDLGYYTQKTATEDFSDQPFGFGLGMRFGTKGGVFNISYALGKQFDNPILFKNAKIHFGYSLIF